MSADAEIGTGLPGVDLSLGGEDRECPECEHSADIPPRRPSIVRKLLKMKPRPATCMVMEEGPSGWGPEPCYCRHTCHGS